MRLRIAGVAGSFTRVQYRRGAPAWVLEPVVERVEDKIVQKSQARSAATSCMARGSMSSLLRNGRGATRQLGRNATLRGTFTDGRPSHGWQRLSQSFMDGVADPCITFRATAVHRAIRPNRVCDAFRGPWSTDTPFSRDHSCVTMAAACSKCCAIALTMRRSSRVRSASRIGR